MTGDELLIGAARLSLEPPLNLPLVGFVRQTHDATGYGTWGLETSAIAVEKDGLRVVLCGVDIVGIGEPEITGLLDRIAAATGADPAGILVNWNHTHLSVVGGEWGGECAGPSEPERAARIRRFADVVQDKVVSVCSLAFERLEPARPVWGVGYAELAVNRRERTADGTTILGWNPDAPVDNQVTSLQFRRPDESVVATAVNYGCHPVTTGYDMYVYSADFPGPLRDVVRRVTGGEAVFLQGAGGNVLPTVAFTADESEAELDGQPSRDRSAPLPRGALRHPSPDGAPAGAVDHADLLLPARDRRDGAARARGDDAHTFGSRSSPSRASKTSVPSRTNGRRRLADAIASGSGNGGAARIAYWHAAWARKTERSLLEGTAPTFREGRIHAVRIGDGVIVSGPGEVFTEIGMAVKERSPGIPTMYAGFTNGLIAYFATAAEYAHGGYEADYSCRGHGNPSHVSPACERILVETGVRAAESLFPEARPWDGGRGWTATGDVPGPLPPDRQVHPDRA